MSEDALESVSANVIKVNRYCGLENITIQANLTVRHDHLQVQSLGVSSRFLGTIASGVAAHTTSALTARRPSRDLRIVSAVANSTWPPDARIRL